MTSRRSADPDVDTLYQAPLDEFVARRTAVAAARRTAGDRAGAGEVKALAKPTAIAWAVNQVWWRDRASVQRLLEAGAAQRAAHVAGADEVRAAATARDAAVKVVVDLAVTALGGAGAVSPDVRHRIVGTIEALAAGGWPQGVAPGRLTRELQPTGLEALGLLGSLAGTAPRTLSPQAHPAAEVDATRSRSTGDAAGSGATSTVTRATALADAKRQAREKQREAARLQVVRLESALTAAARVAADRAADEPQARAAAEVALARVTELEAALERAREVARAARRAATVATTALGEAELARARTARDLAAARATLDSLKDD